MERVTPAVAKTPLIVPKIVGQATSITPRRNVRTTMFIGLIPWDEEKANTKNAVMILARRGEQITALMEMSTIRGNVITADVTTEIALLIPLPTQH